MNLHDAITRMNKLHKESTRVFPVLGITWGVGLLGVIGSALIAPESAAPVIFILYIVVGTVYLILSVIPKAKEAEKELKTLYKDTFLNGMFNEFFDNARYMGTFGFTQHKVREFELHDLGESFESEDHLMGDYKGVHFEQADVHSWTYYPKREHDSTETYFYGRMFIFDLPIHSIQSVKVFNKLVVDVNTGDHRIRGSEQNRVEMESVQFNNAFSVYSEDAHDAFYVLTPLMMDRLMQIYERYCKIGNHALHNISFHFKGSKLYFTMECDNKAFDAGKFPISYPDEKKKLEGDIQVIIDLIEALNLIDKNALSEKEVDEPIRDFWAPSWTTEDAASEVDTTNMADGSSDYTEEEKLKAYTGGLKLKL